MKRNLRFYVDGVTASTTTRTLAGLVVTYGEYGMTSIGRLRVRAGAFRFPEDPSRVKLTKEHNRDQSRGHLTLIDDTPERLRVAARVSDGPDGDDAIRDAVDKTRDGFSFDIVNGVVEGDELISADVVAIGQVGIPAYEPSRIDSIAASNTTGAIMKMTPEQIARLAALRAQQTRTEAEETELGLLGQLEAADQAPAVEPAAPAAVAPAAPVSPPAAPAPVAAPAAGVPVAASLPAVPAGVPGPPAAPARTEARGNALEQFLGAITAGYSSGNVMASITAALGDVVESDFRGIINQPAWSGELWSGLAYEPEFTDLLNPGDLTALEGKGWRFKTKPVIQDYAGDKAPIPTTTVEVESSPWTASRMAVGNDFDRAFYDFPDQYADVLRGYVEFVRESWAMQLDGKVHAWLLANAVPAVGVDPQPTLIKAAAKAVRTLKRRRVGKASFVIANDDDFDTLLDIDQHGVPAFLELFGIDPRNFKSSPNVPQGTVLAGVKQTATVRTLPGSPVRASAQHIANGGIDEAFFGYWAIEEHHTQGIASVAYEAPVDETEGA